MRDRRHSLCTLIAGTAALVALPLAARVWADDTQTGLDLFEKTIRPVLATHCVECHATSADTLPEGGLRVDSRAGLLAGGDSGAVIEPGRPDESLLIAALRYESLEMPPDGKLDEDVIAAFARWIALGAPDPRDTAPPDATEVMARAQAHWAFQPIRRHVAPPVTDAAWSTCDVDGFVRDRQEVAGITPVELADDWTLVRRIYLDLTGLPPTPEAAIAFVSDGSPDRVARLVDRLLDAPEFGERWGRHWLDVARFAESAGGGRSVLFRNAWRYRDYVIASFNDDKPFDEFVREQIAGDLLPADSDDERSAQLIATGFLAVGPKNLDNQDKELLRMDTVDEQLDTVGRALLGLTIGCARCHDHKWDPITTRDYYAMAGILRSTKTLTPGNVSGIVESPLPVDAEWQAALDAHAKKLANADSRSKAAQIKLSRAEQRFKNRLMEIGKTVDDTDAVLHGDWVRSSSVRGFLGNGYLHDDNKDKGTKTATFDARLAVPGEHEVWFFFTPASNRATNTPVVVRHADGEAALTVDETVLPDNVQYVHLGTYRFVSTASVSVSTADTNGHVVIDAVVFVPTADAVAADSSLGNEQLTADIEAAQKAVAQLEADRKALDAAAPSPQPLAMVVRDEDVTDDCPLCIRGDVHKLGDPVPRAAIAALAPSGMSDIAATSGRRELADWITAPENPLTARVIVNRVWHHLFGTGLVRSVDDFGTTGQPPSHPALLDTLAADFVADGWSLKRLIRRLMLTRTYALGSRDDASSIAIDRDSRLLWRANRRRADAEVIRDSLLFVAGRLDTSRGGPSLRDDTESEFGYEFTSLRRSVYLPVLRNATPDVLEVFDTANPNLVVGARSTSSLPSQSLLLLNSPLVRESSQAAAERLLEQERLDDAARVQRAWLETLSRPPLPEEMSLALAQVAAARSAPHTPDEDAELAAWASLYHGLFCCLDFQYVR
ncbi:MAG: DUF1553 domain-containing protein [Pirellulales bacterium]